jgi:hypothetical protein
MSHEAHNAALFPVLKLVTTAATEEADQWIFLESLCLAVGMLHKRDARAIATFIELMAERIATGERDCLGLGE